MNPSDIMNPVHPASPLNPANMQDGPTGSISDGAAICVLFVVVALFAFVGLVIGPAMDRANKRNPK